MEVKKNEKLRLEKNSGLYFAIGLTIVLALAYLGLEWKSFEKESIYIVQLDEPDFITHEVVPVLKTPEPPKPKYIPPAFKVESDDSTIDETIFDIPEPDQNTEIPETTEVPDFEEPPIEEEVIFILVEDKPIFPGCENANDKTTCFQQMMVKHIRKTFRYPEIARELGIEGKVYMNFIIQKDGSIGNISVIRSPNENLSTEATRIISKLPKMQPGKQRGTPVKVPFSIPITFKLQ